MRILFCSCLYKVCSRVSDALSQALCLAFLADFTLSDSDVLCEFDYWPLAVSMPPTKVCPQCKAAVPVRRKTCERCDHVFRSKQKAECNLREKAMKCMRSVAPKNKMAASHVVQIHTHACFPRSKKWPTYHVAVPTGNALASQRSIFRENRLKVLTFIRR